MLRRMPGLRWAPALLLTLVVLSGLSAAQDSLDSTANRRGVSGRRPSVIRSRPPVEGHRPQTSSAPLRRGQEQPSSTQKKQKSSAAAVTGVLAGVRLSGPNVCGKRCCTGWTVTASANRCIKPVCDPPCENKGSCSRPQVCVCRSGFQGSRCEEPVPEQEYYPAASRRTQGTAIMTSRNRRVQTRGKDTAVNQAATSQKVTDQQQASSTQVRTGHATNSQQASGASRTVRRYPADVPIISNALPNGNDEAPSNHESTANRITPRNMGSPVIPPPGANLTSSIDKIKIVFTPTVCKRVCNKGHCYNYCEKGDTTTIYSEGSQTQFTKSGFRMYFCQIPCLNGGHCIGRDECWCPSNSTGKFCHLPVTHHEKQRNSNMARNNKSMSKSMYTLPLSHQLASLHPSLVNVHVVHPPEATVQIHQVARVKGKQDNTTNGQNTIESVQSKDSRSQPSNGNSYMDENSITSDDGQRIQQQAHDTVGRCYEELINGKCGKPVPGLTRKEDCCGSVGAAWGYHMCVPCKPKPDHPVIENGQVQCPKGYKRLNQTHCQDINECQIHGICKKTDCLNTRGSYRCMCKLGYMMDPSMSHCVSDKAVSEVQGLCYRSLIGVTCSLPLAQRITKQICCCSRVGRAWGNKCERCPLPGSDAFNEICPAGHGYTYSRSDIQISMRETDEDEMPMRSMETQRGYSNTWEHDVFSPSTSDRPQEQEGVGQTVAIPSVDIGDTSLEEIAVTTAVPLNQDNVMVKTTLPSHFHEDAEPSNENVTPLYIATQVTELDRCTASPGICGPGTCVNLQNGYTCFCNTGYWLNAAQTKCVDVDECAGNPCGGKGRCSNNPGSYTCHCFTGYTMVASQEGITCQDIDECQQGVCLNSRCINVPGSYRCDCESGYVMNRRGQCEDVDECRNPSACPGKKCVNTAGSFECVNCGPGFKARNGRCVDENECLNVKVCANGRCHNLEGSFRCSCNPGYELSENKQSCKDINECVTANVCPNGICTNTEGSYTCVLCRPGYRVSADGRRCEDFDECASAEVCLFGICTNTEGSFTCRACRPGYRISADRKTCEDIDECASLDTCTRGICTNTEGSYSCVECGTGYAVSRSGHTCEDVNECETFSIACVNGDCLNVPGSYSCTCRAGFELVNGTDCQDVNECLSMDVCGPNGECLNNYGSYFCLCAEGYSNAAGGINCQDVDECSDGQKCFGGQCLNTEGSYLCHCSAGYLFSPETDSCDDVDECAEYREALCGSWSCKNTIGSYQCIREKGCPPGFHISSTNECTDTDECANETLCGSHGFCENTLGSFLCICHLGYQNLPGENGCVDVNECEMTEVVCGRAMCENMDGSFMCHCPDNEEYDRDSGECRPQQEIYPQHYIPESESPYIPSRHTTHVTSSSMERKSCYYNLNDASLCDNVLAKNITKEECCCTEGAGWGVNCNILPCPTAGSEEYNSICMNGKGFVHIEDSPLEQRLFRDVNECALFGSEICKNGRCVNQVPGYNCNCRSGYYYDNVRLECIDTDECLKEDSCMNGECINIPGSFYCFCHPPLILDLTQRTCRNTTYFDADTDVGEHVLLAVCWGKVTQSMMCADPINERQTTYTECCCLYGEAWGQECALCPPRGTGGHAELCNIHGSEGEGRSDLRERAGYEYGSEVPPYGEDPHFDFGGEFGVEQFYSYSSPEYDATYPGVNHQEPGRETGSRDASRFLQSRPPVYQPFPLDRQRARYSGFEGLQSEECGILNGCENGRCVRVPEGYTCDCFDGFHFDAAKMSCLDINECEDIGGGPGRCKHGKCENTEGSYRCICLPGYVASSQPDQCVPSALKLDDVQQ